MTTIIDTKEFAGVPEIKNAFNFLCTPTTTKENSNIAWYENHVHNNGKFWYATDGHRMHKVDLDGFGEEGVYKVIKKTKSQVILMKTERNGSEFPDCEKVWPNCDEAVVIEDCKKEFIFKAYANIVRALDETRTLNFNYLQDVLVDNFTACVGGPDVPIIFKNETMFALIMPMQM